MSEVEFIKEVIAVTEAMNTKKEDLVWRSSKNGTVHEAKFIFEDRIGCNLVIELFTSKINSKQYWFANIAFTVGKPNDPSDNYVTTRFSTNLNTMRMFSIILNGLNDKLNELIHSYDIHIVMFVSSNEVQMRNDLYKTFIPKYFTCLKNEYIAYQDVSISKRDLALVFYRKDLNDENVKELLKFNEKMKTVKDEKIDLNPPSIQKNDTFNDLEIDKKGKRKL